MTAPSVLSILRPDLMEKGFPVSDEIRDGVIADRVAGMDYPAIAVKHGIHLVTARRICARAVARGVVTLSQIGASDRFGKASERAIPKEEYDRQWIVRVKANCVVSDSGCWLWQGTKKKTGYGVTNYRNKSQSVHRGMYQAHHAVSLKTKQYVCHHCDTRNCCNPDHLFLGDQFANMHDSVLKGRHAEQLVTHCPRGHAYDEQNTAYKPNGSRACRICCRGRQRVRMGWSEEEAYSTPPIPQNAKTPRRWPGKKAA